MTKASRLAVAKSELDTAIRAEQEACRKIQKATTEEEKSAVSLELEKASADVTIARRKMELIEAEPD